MKRIRFRFSPTKAKAAIHWILANHHDVDLHGLLKACYFADREHLNLYGRPIFGADYRAMRYGPVPVEIYEMVKGEPMWLAELNDDAYPWALSGFKLQLLKNSTPDLDVLSDTDFECLKSATKKSLSMKFDARTAATHGPDWQSANLGWMRYEDMIDESPRKDEVVAYLREAAPLMRM